MKRIPHPPKQLPKFILHYRLDEVVGYGKGNGAYQQLALQCRAEQYNNHLSSHIGAWGKVKRGWDCESNVPVAVKILPKRRISRKIRNGLERIKK